MFLVDAHNLLNIFRKRNYIKHIKLLSNVYLNVAYKYADKCLHTIYMY